MTERPDKLLDLSGWPAAPPQPAPVPSQRTGLPPRPVPGRRRPVVSLRAAALGALGLGVLLLVVPLGGCGAAIAAWAAETRQMPSDVPPSLDDAEVARDAAALTAARAALSAWRPAASPPAQQSRAGGSSKSVTVSAVDPQEVAAAQAAVDTAERDLAAAQRELDRLLAAQESSQDPASYDGQVAAAREELEQAVARQDEEQRALAVARARTRTVTVTTTASPRPAGASAASTASDRVALAAQVAEAQQVQAAHLAQRAQVVADWRASHEAQVSAVAAHNARVSSCAGRSVVPGGLGAGLFAFGGGVLLRRRLSRA